ncbi:porin [Aestuariivita boseongensis]|uniref:porin n=1 Tax=Aestuariivita boseongensis TaxID=1470562 RepID=UPI0012F73D8C|nr:outer membrane beta-barrel protein [Aestuariivita boseongensis]
MKQKILAAAAASLLAATPALADGEWTGFYAGIGIGNLDVDTNVGLSEDDRAYGVHAGYRFDMGQWVVGGELEHDTADFSLAPGVTVDNVTRLKGTVGYDTGMALVYLALGAADVDVGGVGDDTGEFYGIGLAYQLSPRAEISAEVLEHDFDNIGGSGINADATSVNFRASLRF